MRQRLETLLLLLSERLLPLLVLAILLAYTYALLFEAPYPGFAWYGNGQVGPIFKPMSESGALQRGDQLIQIGLVRWSDFQADLRLKLFEGVRAGESVPILFERGGQRRRVDWVYPGWLSWTSDEFSSRLLNLWPIAYVFWLVGTLTLILARPRDTLWRVLIAFNYLTALWLMLGNFSYLRFWETARLFRIVIWLAMPVYLRLHWFFPKPLWRLPTFVWPLIYLTGIVLAAAQWFQLVPPGAYTLGLIIALLGSLILLTLHFIFRPAERSQIGTLAVASIAAFWWAIVASISTLLAGYATSNNAGSLLALPVLPFAYLFAIYRRRFGTLEFRANRLFAFYLFFTLLGSVIFLVSLAAHPTANFSIGIAISSAGIAIAASLISLASLGRFQRFIESHLFGIRLPPARLVETYAARITESYSLAALTRLLQEEILSSLLIRQSALYRIGETEFMIAYTQGVAANQLPTHFSTLLTEVNSYRPPDEKTAQPDSWVRLSLPLTIDKEPIGLWLFGRRDPDDYYSARDIGVLQTLAHQTAIALTNLEQADRLRALYKADIERHEAERVALARELHDNVLNQLAALKRSVEENCAPAGFAETYTGLVASLRETVADLRPAMLNYGLGAGLEGLMDRLADQNENGPAIEFEVDGDGSRYDSAIELHLYRIVQLACNNVLNHARARRLKVRGCLTAESVELTIEDDGVGFATGKGLNLTELVAHKHFGLAGMVERAELINATLQINSASGRGTRICLRWETRNS